MRATIYGIESKDGRMRRWYVSLDIRVDLEYWLNDPRTRRMLLWDPPVSLGKAVILRRILEQERLGELWKKRNGAERITSRLSQTLKALSAPRLKGSRYGKQPLADQPLADHTLIDQPAPRITAKLIDTQVWRPFGANALLEELGREQPEWRRVSQKSQVEIAPEKALEIAGQLEGRALLREEIISFMEHSGFKQAAGQWKTIVQAAYLFGGIRIGAGVEWVRNRGWRRLLQAGRYRCGRCGSGEDRLRWTACTACGELCPYCENCLTMGRSRLCAPLIMGSRPAAESEEGCLTGSGGMDSAECGTAELELVLDGQQGVMPEHPSGSNQAQNGETQRWNLSPAQKDASDAAVRFVEADSGRLVSRRMQEGFGKDRVERPEDSGQPEDRAQAEGPERFLLWAVTGAGKTEMIFPVIARSLQLQRKVLVATPRKDVVLELLPRLQTAFASCRITALYGGSGQRWDQGDIVIATTHQLIRFRDYFDVVILDEIDAFPYHNNPTLEYTALKSCKSSGKFILLSATPPRALTQQAAKGKLPYAVVPVRHHGRPLPVPVWKPMRAIRYLLNRQVAAIGSGELWRPLVEVVEHGLRREAQIFLFVPKIRLIQGLAAVMREQFPDISVDGTSSEDPDRRRKVTEFREGRIKVLVTTTILERGVTIPKADVIIVDADDPQFDAAALIQMAGRAGRSASDPNGFVYFLSREKNRSQLLAIREIKKMNRLAAQKGFLKQGLV
ncbi:DEAD/DEAH box helicase [Ferviditalea candida]|uniref:Helicase-related protein n=1 Tax=Ferviditalea candida TaxID=3108399 RepID=A0ABU5ZM34_9BACL|nr:helicase-related protein [Paenibacillaceae bacterium T2]